jgi:lipopolysaccharide/colanic/teichoic acid biosynthesis glycosyltransferase
LGVREFGGLRPNLKRDSGGGFRFTAPKLERPIADRIQVIWPGLCIPIWLMFGGSVVKRFVDIVVSAVLLLLALPFLLLAAVLILLTSPGPVLFRQVRTGRGFQPFEILKLRTMAHDGAGLAYTLGPDPRITPIGSLLRRTKLDELPQLWNVLRGEMSLVGPRPVVPELTHEFREFYAFLLKKRPGLTDPASLKYSQEAQLLASAPDPLHFFKTVVTPDKIRLSFEYMGRANLWTDGVTLAMTAVICCFPSMSRVYGDAPEILDVPASVRAQPRHRAERISSPGNENFFSHDLAYLEAAVEEASYLNPLPWILLRNPESRS